MLVLETQEFKCDPIVLSKKKKIPCMTLLSHGGGDELIPESSWPGSRMKLCSYTSMKNPSLSKGMEVDST